MKGACYWIFTHRDCWLFESPQWRIKVVRINVLLFDISNNLKIGETLTEKFFACTGSYRLHTIKNV